MINNIIIFGDPLYKNEDGYINHGLYKAFQSFGYKVYIINKSNINILDKIDKTINMYIINTEQHNNLIPFKYSNYYVLIKCDSNYKSNILSMTNNLTIVEYNNNIDTTAYTNYGDYIYKKDRTIIMPWGSLLTPNEIINNLSNFVEFRDRNDNICMTRNYNADMLRKSNISNLKIVKKRIITLENEKELVEKCKFSLSLNKKPCTIDHKILTHLSYGAMCISDCLLTCSYLDNQICYIDDMNNIETIIETYCNTFKKNNLFNLMENIYNNHTFCHRIQNILTFFNL